MRSYWGTFDETWDEMERLNAQIETLHAVNAELVANNQAIQEKVMRYDREVGELKVLNAELVEALKSTNHHLAKLVNGTDDEDPQTWEDAKNQVLATRAAIAKAKG